MLKLEKASKNREIFIRLRSKKTFLDSTFQRALLIALGLHLFAALLFQISPFKLSNESLLPPIVVEADLSGVNEENDGGISAHIDPEERHHSSLLIPLSILPEAPPLSKLVLLNELKIFDKTLDRKSVV